MFLSGIIRYYFITFFPIYWKKNKPDGSETMAIWMVSCIELAVLSMFPFQELILKKMG